MSVCLPICQRSHVPIEAPTAAARSVVSRINDCDKCGVTKTSGKLSCCARGGAWFKNCGDAGDTHVDHTWVEGIHVCKRRSCCQHMMDFIAVKHVRQCVLCCVDVPMHAQKHSLRRACCLQTVAMAVASAAMPRNPVSAAVALEVVLGSANAEMPATPNLATHGPRAFRLAKVFRPQLRSKHRYKPSSVGWKPLPTR